MAAEQRTFVTNSRRFLLLSLSMQRKYGKRSRSILSTFRLTLEPVAWSSSSMGLAIFCSKWCLLSPSSSSQHDQSVSFLFAPLSAAVPPIRRTVETHGSVIGREIKTHWREVRRYIARKRISTSSARETTVRLLSRRSHGRSLAKRKRNRQNILTHLDHIGISRENHDVN